MSTLAFRPPRGRRRTELSVTPLIDVLFLLIIFFMLTGTFKRAGELELRLPDSTTAEPVRPGAEPVSAQLVATEDGRLYLDRALVTEAELAERLRLLRQEQPERPIVLEAEAEVPHGRIVRLLDAVRRAGFPGIVIGAHVPATEIGAPDRPASSARPD